MTTSRCILLATALALLVTGLALVELGANAKEGATAGKGFGLLLASLFVNQWATR